MKKGNFKNIGNEPFGRLTAIEHTGQRNRHGQSLWLCKCECGNKIVVAGNDLRTGHTKSCGCLQRDTVRKLSAVHGHRPGIAPSPTYVTWGNMIQRCENTKHPDYRLYGGRGIAVCAEWHNFKNFLTDMGERPPGRSIDRYPNGSGNYEPGNCRWATAKEQTNNRRPTSEWRFNPVRESK